MASYSAEARPSAELTRGTASKVRGGTWWQIKVGNARAIHRARRQQGTCPPQPNDTEDCGHSVQDMSKAAGHCCKLPGQRGLSPPSRNPGDLSASLSWGGGRHEPGEPKG